jgi:hypothetical protein
MRKVLQGIRKLFLYWFFVLVVLMPTAAYVNSLFINGDFIKVDFWHSLNIFTFEWFLFGLGLVGGYVYCTIYNGVRK